MSTTPGNPAPAPPTVPGFLDKFSVPRWLRWCADWGKGLGFVALVTGWVFSFFFGKDQGPVFGMIIAGFFFFLYLAYVAALESGRITRAARNILDAGDYVKIEERRAASRKLAIWQHVNTVVVVWLIGIAIALLGVLAYGPTSRWWLTKEPAKIEFEKLAYYEPEEDQRLLTEAPFLDAVRIYLQNEGKAGGKRTSIIIGYTKGLPHPTPPFKAYFKIKAEKCEVTGYAFRRHEGEKRTIYEPVPADYSSSGEMFLILSVPPCEAGDTLFFIGRLSLDGDRTEFPDDPKSIVEIGLHHSAEGKK